MEKYVDCEVTDEREFYRAKVIGYIPPRDLLARLNKDNPQHWDIYPSVEDMVIDQTRKELVSMPRNTCHVGIALHIAFLKRLIFLWS